MAILNSNRINIRLEDENRNRVRISNVQNVSFDFIDDLIEVTTRSTGSWREVAKGIRSVTMSFDALLDTDLHEDIIDDILEGQRVRVYFGPVANSLTGLGFIEGISVSGGVDDAISISGSIIITGDIVEEVILGVELLLDNNLDPITDNTGETITTLNIQ